MGKLTLKLEDLTVDSFETTAAEKERGTVVGQQLCTCYTNCTCPGCPTCDATCPATCPVTCDDASCGGTCDTCYGGTCEGTCYVDGCGISQWDTCRRICGTIYPEPYYPAY